MDAYTLSHDPKGNLLSRPAALASPALGLVRDFDDGLRGADTIGTPATQEVTFEDDALGRRVARSEAGNNVVYVHAGQQVIADYARGAAAAPSVRVRQSWVNAIAIPWGGAKR